MAYPEICCLLIKVIKRNKKTFEAKSLLVESTSDDTTWPQKKTIDMIQYYTKYRDTIPYRIPCSGSLRRAHGQLILYKYCCTNVRHLPPDVCPSYLALILTKP